MIVDLSLQKYNGMTEEQATHAAAEEITQNTAAKSLFKREFRSYEVSLWSLQDEFITVLKWSDIVQDNRIQEPKLTIDIDGTQNFTFSVPMYINVRKDIERNNSLNTAGSIMETKENPIWYTIKDDTRLLLGMRKIKVIFNKMVPNEEKVFEFLITKVTEEHEKEVLTCRVECEGLAFHELGKIGYKYSLSLDDFVIEYDKWVDEMLCTGDEPIQNIQFWCEKIGLKDYDSTVSHNSSVWYYKVDMDWSSYYALATGTNINVERQKNRIYEEAFTSVWNDDMTPAAVVYAQEKARTIEVSESNIYNITQTIAEQFGVHCRYEYEHDENYHIVGRIVVFYNNYLKEKEGIIGFTYPYSSTAITRELDSTDLTTKMYVQSVDDSSLYDGYVSIMNNGVNKTKEDYLLNFEYMHTIGAITNEQYAAIKDFEQSVRRYNDILTQQSLMLNTYYDQKTDLEAKIATYTTSKELDEEQINNNSALLESITSADGSADGLVTLTNAHPDMKIIKEKDGQYYISMTDTNKGIKQNTIRIYRNYSSGNPDNQITNFRINNDEFGNIETITGIAPTSNSKYVYLYYDYKPQLYYDNITRIWEIKLANDTIKLEEAQEKLGEETTNNNVVTRTGLIKLIYDAEQEYNNTLQQKEQLLKDFEHMLGPALREGYWTPDNYQDYGEHKIVSGSLSNTNVDMIADSGDGALIGWDSELFDDEEELTYSVGVNETPVYYPCINLNFKPDNGDQTLYEIIRSDPTSFSFMYGVKDYDSNYNINDISYLKIFAIGSEAIIRFIKHKTNYTIIPILILLGAKTLSDDELTALKTTERKPRIGKINISYNNNAVETSVNPSKNLTTDAFITDLNDYEIVYPRIKISNLLFKNTTNDVSVIYNNILLEPFSDYSILTRTTTRATVVNDQSIDLNYPEYFITLKTDSLIPYGYTGDVTVNYTLSNAGTAIYLDAMEVLKENSEPKVSYTIKANVIDVQRIKTAYLLLSQLVMINDVDLKFENTFGYISHLDLDLDAPQNDEYEIKNYKTKFEDLFSSIVASTEEMKKNGDFISSVSTGSIVLSGQSLASTLAQNTTILNNYFDDYFLNSATVEAILKSLWDEAGSILGQTNSLLTTTQALSIQNSSILGSFAQKVSETLAPKVYRSKNQPTSFKTGDIWIELDNNSQEIARYIAISDSQYAEDGKGFVRTYKGGLASITGASLDVDAVAGTIDILAENQITLASGGNIDIAANEDVNIHGNKSVNIGGTIINIGSAQETNDVCGGINLIATSYDTTDFSSTKTSRVIINPQEIEMAGSKVSIFTGSDAQSTEAIKLDSDGIWLGSNKSITLYSGAPVITDNSTTYGANIELNSGHILFGVNAAANAASMEITPEKISMGVGTSRSASITDTNGTGMILTRNSFGLAIETTDTNNIVTRRSMIMNENGLKLFYKVGSGTGSYVLLNGSGVTIASGANLNVNTNNFYLHAYKTDNDATNVTIFQLKNGNTSILKYTADGKLDIVANSLTISASNLTITSGSSSQSLSQYMSGFTMTDAKIWAGVKRATENTNLSLTDNSISLNVNYQTTETEDNVTSTIYHHMSMNINRGGILLAAQAYQNYDNNANYLKARSNIQLTENGIEMNAGHVYINEKEEWSRDDLIWSVKYPSDHPSDRDWIWIQPISNASSEGSWSTSTTNYKMSYKAAHESNKVTVSTGTMDNIGSNPGTFTVTVKVTAIVTDSAGHTYAGDGSNQYGSPKFNIGIKGATNNIVMCTYDNSPIVVSSGSGRYYQLGVTITATSSKTFTNNKNPLGTSSSGGQALNITVQNNCSMWVILKKVQITVTVEDVTSRVPCNVYYIPAPQT